MGVKRETAIGRFAWQRWEWTLSLMNKSVNKFLAYQNVIQSLEQQFDYFLNVLE